MSAELMPTSFADEKAPPRLWPALLLLGLYWALAVTVGLLEFPYFFRFLYSMASAALLTLAYGIWWWTRRRWRLSDRALGTLLLVGGLAAAFPLCDPSLRFGLFVTGVPIVLTVGTLWMLLSRKTFLRGNRVGAFTVVALTWAAFGLIRMDGVNADLKADVRWRWSPSAEDLFRAQRASQAEDGETTVAPWSPALSPGDWTGFRGPNRDGVVRGATIPDNWDSSPPRLLWRHRVGPAWSSMVIIGNRLFTQEQHDEQEAVVCYDALTGKQIWIHKDPARFWEAVSGPGPRATPSYADGRLFTFGATGLLNCLDADTGKSIWLRDVAASASVKPPLWGFSCSPLVVGGQVIVPAGDKEGQSLWAYRVADGEPTWSAAVGAGSYSSPQLATLAGKTQCLILSERGLTSVDPATGAVLWETGTAMPGAPRTLQPNVVGPTQLLVSMVDGPGLTLLNVTESKGQWRTERRWTTNAMKPEFPDFVVHDGHAYGFDGAIFACIDLATGKRCWKGGRYGRGQVVLLADQALLLVMTEMSGEAILVEANPERHQERARFTVLEGKTWNHPVIAHGRLYVRNAEEMACYALETTP